MDQVEMSNEKERATFYKDHKDDPDVWEPISNPDAPKRPLDVTVSVRIAAEDATALRSLAKKSGLRYSDVIRMAVSQYVRPRFTIERGNSIWGIFQGRLAPPATDDVRLEIPTMSRTGPTAPVQ